MFSGFVEILPIVIALSVGDGAAWGQERSPSELVRHLTYESDGPDKLAKEMGLISCGQTAADLSAAKELVKFGDRALPEIEAALDTIETGEPLFGARWLLLAYARIGGQAAYPRLKRMMENPKLSDIRSHLSDAMALSLDLTSYVTDSGLLARRLFCFRQEEPRDGLDQLILAWLKGDRVWMEASLGSDARRALDSLLKKKTWAEIRAELIPSQPNGRFAIGYRFQDMGRWGRPSETLDGFYSIIIGRSDTPTLETQFKDASGNNCSVEQIKFIRVGGFEPAHISYLVDNADLTILLRSIASCVSDR
jgi:hypothetical protein